MEGDATPAGDNLLGQNRPARTMRPLASRSSDATIHRRSTAPRPTETRAPATRGIPAYHSARRHSASNGAPSVLPEDVQERASSMTPLAIQRRLDIPAFL